MARPWAALIGPPIVLALTGRLSRDAYKARFDAR